MCESLRIWRDARNCELRQKIVMLCFSSFFNVFSGFLGGLIIPKWLILTSGPIAILFGWFLELPNNRQNLDPRTPYLSPNISGNTRKSGNILETYYFAYLRIWMFESFGKYKCWALGFFGIWKSEYLTTWKFDNLKMLNLKIGSLQFGKMEIENL